MHNIKWENDIGCNTSDECECGKLELEKETEKEIVFIFKFSKEFPQNVEFTVRLLKTIFNGWRKQLQEAKKIIEPLISAHLLNNVDVDWELFDNGHLAQFGKYHVCREDDDVYNFYKNNFEECSLIADNIFIAIYKAEELIRNNLY